MSSSLRKDDAMRTLSLDVGMDFSRINRDLIASMELLEPFGKGMYPQSSIQKPYRYVIQSY